MSNLQMVLSFVMVLDIIDMHFFYLWGHQSDPTGQAVHNITLISQNQTKTKSCKFIRTFSNISEFAN